MRVCSRVYDDTVVTRASVVNGADDFPLSIVLHAIHVDGYFTARAHDELVDFGKGLGAVYLRLSLAEQIQTRPVYYQYAHATVILEGNATALDRERIMPDMLISAAAPDAGIALVAAITTELVREIRERHDLSPTATAATGRLSTGAVLFGSGLKGHERITLQIAGDGPIGAVASDAWLLEPEVLGARGYARNPYVDISLNDRGKFDVAGAVGSGSLHVTKSYERGAPYVGVVPLYSGEVAEDLAAYLVKSEQIPSVVALGVLANPEGVRAAGGVLAQVLPGADERAVATLEACALAMKPVTTLIDEGADAHALLHALAGSLQLRSHRSLDIRFACLCSRKKVEGALLSMGPEELARLAGERSETEATCEFCKRVYVFTSQEVLALADVLRGANDDTVDARDDGA